MVQSDRFSSEEVQERLDAVQMASGTVRKPLPGLPPMQVTCEQEFADTLELLMAESAPLIEGEPDEVRFAEGTLRFAAFPDDDS